MITGGRWNTRYAVATHLIYIFFSLLSNHFNLWTLTSTCDALATCLVWFGLSILLNKCIYVQCPGSTVHTTQTAIINYYFMPIFRSFFVPFLAPFMPYSLFCCCCCCCGLFISNETRNERTRIWPNLCALILMVYFFIVFFFIEHWTPHTEKWLETLLNFWIWMNNHNRNEWENTRDAHHSIIIIIDCIRIWLWVSSYQLKEIDRF